MDSFRDYGDLAAENAKLREENSRLKSRLEEKDRQLSQVFSALAHAKNPEKSEDDGVLVLYSNVRGWLWVMSKLGQFVIWLSAVAAAIYGVLSYFKTLK